MNKTGRKSSMLWLQSSSLLEIG